MPRKLNAIAAAWYEGELSFLLHEAQMDMYRAIERTKSVGKDKKFVINCSRRIGKSFLMAVLATETCLRKRNARVKFAAPTGDALEEIILPIFDEILKTCPRKIRPVYKAHKKKWVFKNRSEIKLSGVEKGHYSRLRGPRSDLNLIDEAGFMDCLPTLDADVLMPQLMYSPGIMVIASTPPDTPGHPFTNEYCGPAAQSGNYIEKTVWDNPRLSLDEILFFAKEAKCEIDWDKKLITKESTTWQREYLAQHVTEQERAVIPEFNRKAPAIIKDWQRPEFCYKWTIMDTGFIDFTAVLFCYFDFKNAKVVFEDELLIDFKKEEMNTKKLAKLILDKEKELWGDEKPHLRFADGDLIVINEMDEHGVVFNQVVKDELEAQVNQARLDVSQESVIFTPKCTQTAVHFRFAIWNKKRRAFDRVEGMGHFDLLACGLYALRHINRHANPWPKLHGIDTFKQYVPKTLLEEDNDATLRRMFKI